MRNLLLFLAILVMCALWYTMSCDVCLCDLLAELEYTGRLDSYPIWLRDICARACSWVGVGIDIN